MTRFVGRRRELAEVKTAIADSRLVTLVGPGGMGKTRIAYEFAERSRRAFRDGVWIVDLASVEDEASLALAVVSTLAVPDQSNRPAIHKLTNHLRQRQLLLVLDNCEHLLAAVGALVYELLAGSRGLRILATSREPLGITGEHLCVIPPMTTPPPDKKQTPESLDQFEAVRLLIDRAREVIPEFAVTQKNSMQIAQLCNQLDGMPLAIELAASRLRSLSVTQIVQRLDKRFRLLIGGNRVALPRHQTLRALIDWSYELCSDTEKLLWARLSVFTGSFDLDAAEQVCGFGDLAREEVVDVLDRLVAKSILAIERDGECVRYRLLMTIREYGSELLQSTGESATVRRRHRDHYLRRATNMVHRWCGSGQADALAAMRRDHPNLMAALEWSVTTSGQLGPGAALASMLRYHWIAGGYLADGRRWLEQILTVVAPSNPQRGAVLWVSAWVALIQGDRGAAAIWLDESGELARANCDDRLAAHTEHWTGLHRLFSGDTATAVDLFERAAARFVELGDQASHLAVLFMLATAQTYDGRHQDALRTCAKAQALSSAHGERWAYAYSLWISGVTRWHLGDLDGAERNARSALTLQRDFKDSICVALTIELLAWIEVSRTNVQRAAELVGAARSVWTGLGTTVDAFGPGIRTDSVTAIEQITRALGHKRIDDVFARSANLGKDAAIELALGGVRTVQRITEPASLTKREREIAELIAQGMSNRAIAEALVISPRTVDGHVERILAKLDFTSRTQIASWVASRANTHPLIERG
ncbi:AAA family ATPase [Mycobacterium sp. SM1]|nr:AAA family ATPase [Mycobacterium sp. SM1]